MRVLITGFGPFPGAPVNPSAALAKALAKSRRAALSDLEIFTHVFATAYAAVDRDLPKILKQQPDVVLLFGLAGRRRHVCVETRARNRASLIFPDATGEKPKSGVIESGGPAALAGRAPFVRLRHALRQGRVPARLSRDAGTYLCNYVFWRALRASGGGPLVQFIHIPSIRQQAFSLPRLTRATEALLIALVAASRR